MLKSLNMPNWIVSKFIKLGVVFGVQVGHVVETQLIASLFVGIVLPDLLLGRHKK